MKKKLKSFFSVVKLESIRIFRNRYIFLFLLLFPSVMILILGSLNVQNNYKVAVNYSGLGGEAFVSEIISQNIPAENIMEVNSDEEGKNLLKNGTVSLYILFNAQTQPVTATFYYDSSSNAGATIKEKFKNMQNEYAYQTITEFLSTYGITVNNEYFHSIEFQPYNNEEITFDQRFFITEIGTFLSIILLFGMAYSVARDNETGVYRQVAYTPLGLNKYLLSKAFPYLVLGLFQSVIMLLMGAFYFNIAFKANVLLILLFMFLFVCSTVFLGLLISQFKYQIITAFFAMIIILLPMFALRLFDIDSYPFFVKVILHSFPLSSFMNLLKFIIFNGIVKIIDVIILLLQSAVFYLSVYFILKKRVRK